MAPPGRPRGRPRLAVSAFIAASHPQNQQSRGSCPTTSDPAVNSASSSSSRNVVSAENAPHKRPVQGETESPTKRRNVVKKKENFAKSNTILSIGNADETCGYCYAKVWAHEFTGRHVGQSLKGYSICCGKGKVLLPMLQATPPELNNLLTDDGSRGRMFRNKKLLYNNMFSFTYFGGNIDRSLNNGSGPFVFRVRGHTCHNIGSLHAPVGREPKYAQLYMYDGQEEIDKRMQFPRDMNDIDATIVAALSDILNRENALVEIYKQVRERFRGIEQSDVRLRLLERRATDGRLQGSQYASVCPDIIARVFKIKLDMMLSDLTKKDALGRLRAVVYTIEFQKRGLPHAHIVLWLADGDILLTPTDIDNVICAEIPNKDTDIVGYNAVSQYMMHGPCGEANPRRDTGLTVEVNKIYLDNRHVVPFNRAPSGATIPNLSENMRLEKDVPPVTVNGMSMLFRDWILRVGDGMEQNFDLKHDGDDSWIQIPEELQLRYEGDPIQAIVDEIYSDLNIKHGSIPYLHDRSILTPLNESVEVINREVLKRLPEESKIYRSCDTICKGSTTSDTAEALYPTEYLNSLRFSGMPNHEIELKIGAPVMLLRNLNPKKGLCNGTRLIVTRCYSFLIEAVIITGTKIGHTAYIPRITMTPADKTYPFLLKRKQFPVALCYAMSINKSQGQTMKTVGLYLPNPIFSHGQLYVAISRVTSPCGLKIVCANEDPALNGYTKNVVYKEIFGDIA
ncbi:hypothetical protein POM88_001066 [Heracleum sosnowskyi]|uniref:ATP-dependent DNA helicase n=1 Tax=Heracleum sosnowskyi TaxID=360622 RepID=A0AAD8NAD1_9APIA|nr:hypothetical protein POM88_001066 [Heracleum sosnowskyi]